MKAVLLMFCFFSLVACSDKPKVSSGDEASAPLPVDSSLSSLFPYEFGFDALAYMSCEKKTGGTPHPPGTFFTFKLGAYNPGAGLKISSEVVDKIKDQDFFQQVNSFNSAFNKNGADKSNWTLQLGLRGSDFSSFANLLPVSSVAQGAGFDYNVFLYNSYGEEGVLTQLLNLSKLSNPHLRYQGGVLDSLNPYRYFEQSLGEVGLSTDKLIKVNNNEYRLSVFYTYLKVFKNHSAEVAESFRGRSFKLNFDTIGGVNDIRKLANLTEYKVNSSEVVQDSSNWQCDSYQIMRDQDRGLCDTLGSEAGQSAQPVLKQAMENIWGATGFWKFNHSKKCAVYQLSETVTDNLTRKGYNVCYDESKLLNSENANPQEPGRNIAYQGLLAPPSGQVFCDSTNPSASPHCPHFLSACWR